MVNPIYPARNNSEAIELNISNANQFFTVLQGGIDDTIPTYEGNGEIPSVAKALNEAAAYKVPLAWGTTGESTDLMQPYEYDGNVYVPIRVPAPFSTAPSIDYWRLYSQKQPKVYADTLFFDGNGVTVDFSIPSATISDPSAYFVTIDGIVQRPTIDYTVNIATDTLTFTEAPPAPSSGSNNIAVTLIGEFIGGLSERIYDTSTEGLDATPQGQYFQVRGTDPETFVDLYKNGAGTAVLIDSYPNKFALDNALDVLENAVGDAALRQDPAIQAHLRPLVIVASGQSNMDGAGDGGEMPGENSLVQMFDLTTRAFRAVSYTTPIDRKNVNNGATMKIPSAVGKNNLAFSFCHAAFEETGRPVYLIIVSNGGTHIGRWVGSDQDSVAGYEGPWGPVGTAKPLYVELKAAVEEALQIIGASKIDAFLWHQGETKRPGFESPSDYEADFSTLHTQLAAETWWSDNTQLIVGEQIIGSYYRNAENYNDIWRAFNDNGDPNIKAVSQEGLAMNAAVSDPDSVHFDGQSLYELGRRYWRAYLGDKAAMARRGDPETTLFGANSQTLDWSREKFNVAVRIDPYRERVIENVAPATPRAWGGYQAGLRVVNNTSCAVVHNSNGTFDVTPNGLVAQNWSFDIEQFADIGPAVSRQASNDTPARITGAVDLTKREKFRLWLDGDTSASINIDMTPRLREGTLADDLIEIDWGDGTVDTGLSTGTNLHSYVSAYTGWVTVFAPSCCEIKTLLLDDGRWRSPLSALSHLSQLTYLRIGGDNEMHGDLGDLPASLVTCIIEGSNECTWDFTRLPNLKNLTATGANTINAPKRSAEMVAFTRLILDGADRTASQVDDVLIAMSKIPEWDGTADIFLNYAGQAAPSPASSAAISDLQAKGVTVNTN